MPPALDGLTLLNWGKLLFWPVHQKFGGRLRLLISGGSALPTETMKALRGLGFNLFEGYGLTEASPVLTVNRPGTRLLPGTVGEPLPGIDVRIDNPDGRGVGEIVATRAQRHARLLRESRRHRRRSSTRTAGCTPATSAASTTTDASTSSGARRR